MKEQKDLQIIKIEEIMINPENPRHNEVQLTIPEMGEELIMKQLIKDSKTAQDLLPDVFKDLPINFHTSILDKILASKEGKKFLNIDNIDNILTFTSSMNDTEEKLRKIVDDIKSGNVNSKTVQSNKKIKEYLNKDKINEPIKVDLPKDNTLTKAKNSIEEDKSKMKLPEQSNHDTTQIKLSDLEIPTILPPESNIKKEDTIVFSNLNINNLDTNNKRADGIRAIAYEIQRSSRKNGDKYYPISYCFLLRALLEQTSIYFLININRWDKLVSGKSRDLNLGEIIKYITNNADNLFSDNINIKRSWNIVFDSYASKDYLDLVIHHPYNIYPNMNYIKTISDIGLFAIIQ